MRSGLAAVIMAGGGGHTPVERLVVQAREAITRDTVARLLRVEPVECIVVATDSPVLASTLAHESVIVDFDPPEKRFHFGRRLSQILADYDFERCLYIGGGSGALLTLEDWRQIAAALADAKETVITNNFYSTDFAAWTPATALDKTSLPNTFLVYKILY